MIERARGRAADPGGHQKASGLRAAVTGQAKTRLAAGGGSQERTSLRRNAVG
jgi:hypothetical protein